MDWMLWTTFLRLFLQEERVPKLGQLGGQLCLELGAIQTTKQYMQRRGFPRDCHCTKSHKQPHGLRLGRCPKPKSHGYLLILLTSWKQKNDVVQYEPWTSFDLDTSAGDIRGMTPDLF